MKQKPKDEDSAWIALWLDAVKDGRATMSQRAHSSIEKHGGLTAVTEAAQERGVHLVELTDDKGRKLVAASQHPFKTLC